MDDYRKKVKFRAWRRGFREMDLLMGTFADRFISDMEDSEVVEFERLLATPDWEVYAWIIGQKPIPDNHKSGILDRLIAFRYEAQPG